MKSSAYANLAKWFEYLNDDCDYEKWSQYLIAKLKNYPCANGLDVGCGAGWFTRAFEKQGYKMVGMDNSVEMLDTAQQTAFKTGVRSEYILGDITAKKPQKKFDFVTAINDCVNYIPKGKLPMAFKNIAGALKKNGVFLFDISSKRKFEQKIANTVSVDDRDDVTYLSFNHVQGDKVTMEVTVFERQKENVYIRKDETHTQYIYEEEEIVLALENAGFSLLQVEGHLGEEKSESDRICFFAKKD